MVLSSKVRFVNVTCGLLGVKIILRKKSASKFDILKKEIQRNINEERQARSKILVTQKCI